MIDRPHPFRAGRFAAALSVAAVASSASGCFALSLDGEGRIDNPITGARLSNLESRVSALEQVVMPPAAAPGPVFPQ